MKPMTGTQEKPALLTEAQVRDILASIAYRGWKFHLVWTEEQKYLQVQFFSRDTFEVVYEGFSLPTLQHGRKWLLSPHMVPSEIVQTALLAVLTAEEHETREAFKYHGVAVFSPHMDLFSLAEARNSGCVKLSYRPKGLSAAEQP